MSGINKYFNFYKLKGEQSLIDDLMVEAIQVHGINGTYIPRSNQDVVDFLYGEDPLAKFTTYFEVPMYIKTVEGFNGRAVFQKWGITLDQSAVFQIAKTEFLRAAEGSTLRPNRPREGDLIYLSYGISDNLLFEVKYVKDNVPFEQLGKEYLFEVECKLFTYSNEEIKTGLPAVDAIGTELKQQQEIEVLGSTEGFIVGEVVYQGDSFATSTFKAVIKSVSVSDSRLTVQSMAGKYQQTAPLKGNTSLTVSSVGEQTRTIPNDAQSQNQKIATESTPVIKKNRRNPFDKGRI